jgi:hypothetical protein
MTPFDPQYSPIFENLARGSAHTVETLWRRLGITMPPGAADRFGRVVAEFMRGRKDPLSDAMFNIGMTRLREIIDAAEKEVSDGKQDPRFLDIFAAKVREEFESYERQDPEPSA